MITTRITEVFGCRHPLQQAGMGGIASPALALAVADAGGIGMLSGVYGRAALAGQLDEVPGDAVVGVAFLVPFLDMAALEDAADRVPYVELFWGDPDAELVERIHAGGALAGWQVGSLDEARSAVDAGCEVVVVQGVEAGGHVRATDPLLSLVPRVREAIEVPLIAAGGIGTGRAMADALGAGADAARVGTRFMAAVESTAHMAYVEALIAATAEDTVVTTAFGEGWPDAPHRVLRSSIEAGRRLGAAQRWTPDWPAEGDDGPVEARALYAGTSVDGVRARQPAAEIVSELVAEAERVMAR